MKNHLLPSIIADLLKSAKGYAKRTTQITPAGNRFKTFSLKPVLVQTALVVFSLFMANTAFAVRRITQITVNAQSVTPTYGTATAGITYTITVTSTGTANGTVGETIKISGLPAGATSDIPVAGIAFTPNGTNNQQLTFHISTAINTPANATGWSFLLQSSANNGSSDNVNGLLKINPKALTITGGTITANDKPYDGNTNAVVSSSGVTYGGLVAGDVVSISTTGTFTPNASASLTAKTVTIALAGASAGNYVLTQPSVTAKINAAAITITASNQTKTYGQTLTSGAGKTTGFTTSAGLVSGETPKLTINYGTAGNGNAAVGTYSGAAVPSAAVVNNAFNPANYAITYVAGDVTINQATLIVKANNPASITYGAALPTYTAAVTTQNGESTASVFDASTLVFSTTPTNPPSNVGTYTITPSGGTVLSSNYSPTITYQTGTLTIGKATLNVTANDVTKIFGTTLTPGGGYTNFTVVSGLKAGETITSFTVSYVNDGDAAADPIGNYPNTINLANPVGSAPFNINNYTLATVNRGDINVVAAIYDWTGATSSVWALAGNWKINGVLATTYPGQGTADQARIGVAAGTITNQPELTANLGHSLTSLTFGNASGVTTLTTDVGTTITFGTLNVNANTTANIADVGTVAATADYNDFSTSVLNITGSKSFVITNSGELDINGTINHQGTGTVTLASSGGNNLVINGTISLQNAGSMSVTGSGILQNTGTIAQSGSGTMTLNGGTGVLGIFTNISGIFNNNIITQSGSGLMTFSNAFHNNSYPNATPASSIIQTGSGSMTFNNNFNNGLIVTILGFPVATYNGGPVSFGGGTSTVTFKGAVTNTTGTIAFGTGPSFFNSALVNNNSTANSITFGTGLATFNEASTGVASISMPRNYTLTLVNTSFTNAITHTFTTNGATGALAAYIIRSDGVMTLSSNTTCDFTAALSLTLNSDATGSATIAALANTNQITGLANKAIVQRFIKGSTDQSKRGYRLITSTVYTGTTGGSNVYDLTYLKSTNLSGFGLSANGFNLTNTTNPTIYLFREDDPPPPALTTIFTTGYNWKGVAKINNTPAYMIGTQTKLQTANVLDTTVTIPVGNGILYFFRGGGLVNNYSTPFAAPADATLSETGTLNVGTIPVTLWYAGAAGLGNNLSYTVDAAHTSAPAGSLTSGFNLVGNPYPSTINWEKYQSGGANGNVNGNTIYVFNPFNKQYEAYQQVNNGDLTSEFTSADTLGNAIGAASNFIASGQGFFVQATGPGQNLTFTENLKISAQPTQSNLNKLMSKSAPIVAAPVPFLQLKMVKDSLNFDEVIIRFKENSNANYVVGEDAVDMGGSEAPESFSVFSADSIKLAISAMPLPGLKPSVVHLFTGSPTTGPYSLNVKALKNLPALYNVWLKDGFTGDSVDLKKTTTYAFTIDKSNAATFGANRFTVVFSQDTANAYRLLNFDAQKTANEQKVQTTWKTKNEQNYTNFTVERSTDDGQTFNVVGGMHGTGAGLYSLVDKNPSKGDNVYRLKQEDINNVITYSNLVEVFFGNKNDRIHLYPNPAVNVINVDVRDRWHDRDRYEIIVTNSAGTVVKHGTSGDSQWQAGISNLRPGTYLVSVLSKDDKNLVGQAKFVKL